MDTGRPPFRYNARLASEIELRWQDRWEREGTFHAANPTGALSAGAVRRRRPPVSGRRPDGPSSTCSTSVIPDACAAYGADTLRLSNGDGPLDGDRPWHTDDITGMHRFLQRLWRLIIDESTGEPRVAPDPLAPSTPSATSAPPPLTPAPPPPRAARRGRRPAAAPDHRRRAGGLRRAAVPHRDRADHRADRARVPAAARAARPGRAAGADGGAAGSAYRRGTVAAPRSPVVPGPRAVPAADPALGRYRQHDLPVHVNCKVRFSFDAPASADRDDIAEQHADHPAHPATTGPPVTVPGKIANIVLR